MPKYKQSNLDPKEIAKWWQEAYDQIRLAHPHETKANREKLTEKYITSRIKTVLKKKTEIPDPGERPRSKSVQYGLVSGTRHACVKLGFLHR